MVKLAEASADEIRSSASTRRRIWRPVPGEGENGVFTQSWYAVAWSSDVPAGKVIGRDFLDGRIVLFRGANGRVVATGAYCPHVGADLSVGEVIGDTLRCAFHHWQYDQSGACIKTGVGDKVPKGACLYVFPTTERYGIVFVFNGDKPLFDIPSFSVPDDELLFGSPYPVQTLNCDPWVFCANTPDMQHFKAVHKIKFDHEDPHELYAWHEFGFHFRYVGSEQDGAASNYELGIRGTTIFYRYGTHIDFYRASIVAFGVPRPGQLVAYSVNGVRKGPRQQEHLDLANSISARTLNEDKHIMDTIHYRPGHLTKDDKSLSRFLNYVRKYPRAHPSANFIR
jgi:phenylpropionate dioxygenase-like ring-hydroxylating dioxygenase large terminal subunit